MKDAYNKLFEKYPKHEFFKDSFEQIIFVESGKAQENWEQQMNALLKNKKLFIRGYGRDAKGTEFFLKLYKNLFWNQNIQKDPTNNSYPTKLLTQLTWYSKYIKKDRGGLEKIQNYQVSHLFGRTKNPLLFTAAWNIAYIPKYLDPFTWHETQGEHRNEFQKIFTKQLKALFKTFIESYNLFVDEKISPFLSDALVSTKTELQVNDKIFDDFSRNAKVELSKIVI